MKRKISIKQLCGISDEAGASLDLQIKVHKELGWNSLELRTIHHQPLHHLSDIEIEAVLENIQQNGMKVPVIASSIGNWSTTISAPLENDLLELEQLIRFGKKVGTRYIRIMSYPNADFSDRDWELEVKRRVCLLAKIAFDNGIKILHENCHGWAASDPNRALALVEATEGKGFGLLFDIGNPTAHQYDGLNYFQKILQHIEHIHIKDAVTPKRGRQDFFTFPGEGNTPLLEYIDLLLATGYEGLYSIEPHISLIPHKSGQENLRADLPNSYLEYGERFISLLGDRFENI